MNRWGSRLDWEHLQNWVPGVVGASAVILLVVVAANSPMHTNSRPVALPLSQSAAPSTEGQTGTTPVPSQPAASQRSSVAENTAKAPVAPTPAPVVTRREEASKPAATHYHAMVKTQAEQAAPAQAPSLPDHQDGVAANGAGLQGDPVAGRQVFKKCQACHSLEPGKTILGPSLAGIVGRKSGAEPDFNYSPAMK